MKSNLLKKQLTMVTLVLALALAVYLNWSFASKENALIATETMTGGTNSEDKHYGDALFVSSDTSDAQQYFAEARLNRETARAEALELLEKALQNTDLTQAEKDEILEQMASIARSVETESTIESLIKAKGFADCVAYINCDSINIVVKSKGDGLAVSDVSQIKEIVISASDISVENITIVEIK